MDTLTLRVFFSDLSLDAPNLKMNHLKDKLGAFRRNISYLMLNGHNRHNADPTL